MRIFYSHEHTPMLLDTAATLNILHQQLLSFLTSSLKKISITAEVSLNPAPYDMFLNGLRVEKTQGSIMLRLSQDHWLELTGSEANLAKYVSHFHFGNIEDNDHHHPDNGNYMSTGSLRLIIEADSTWSEVNAG
jgi:hypothetical protein